MKFKGIQKTFKYTQLNNGAIEKIFPLLCPIREKDWIEGWDCKMIHSTSGLIEKDCVFTTSPREKIESVWHVTHYDQQTHKIEFLRFTPSENVAKITIELEEINKQNTRACISYQYTALCEKQNTLLNSNMEQLFLESMTWWEKSINYYLKTGNMLKKKKGY